jgi:glycogen debranching enzyme
VDQGGTERFLAAFDYHLGDGCVGTVSEIFDAEAPYAARGCVAQAWSVAEVLRCAVYAARDRDKLQSSASKSPSSPRSVT